MQPEFRLHERNEVRIQNVGNEASPVIVIDDFLNDPDALLRYATSQFFLPVTHRAYPGIRAAMPPAYATAVRAVLREVICDTFGLGDGEVMAGESSFSIITKRPEELHVRQRMPHFDSTDTSLIALLHYLCGSEQGGTSFYRHRGTGYEIITPGRLQAFDRAVDQDLTNPQPAGYINGDTAHFERIASCPAAFNRMIIYRGASLHSGDISKDFHGDRDPRTGRLTANTFFLFRPR